MPAWLPFVQVEPVMKTDYEDVWDWRVENDNKPLWTRSPREVAEADYNEFFKQVRRVLMHNTFFCRLACRTCSVHVFCCPLSG
jgi:HSP90 family molecular chaperone